MGKMNYKILLPVAVVTIISVIRSSSMSTEQIAKRKPHIIFIIADDLGWNDVSWHNEHIVMPYIHDLAMNGVILNSSYAQPTCTPSRSAVMTGTYPFRMGLQKGVIRPTEPRGVPRRAKMLPQHLKEVGYKTYAIGKWHLGFCSWLYTPNSRGFDQFYGFYTGAIDYYTYRRGTPAKPGEGKDQNRESYLDLRNNTDPDDTKTGNYSTHLFGSVAEEIVRTRDPEDPMFMYLAFQSVHAPLQVPKNYSDIYSHIKDDSRRVLLGMVTAMDEAVGRLVTALKETGHYDNSVIIFTSDNGGSIRFGGSNWPLRGGKATLWEGGIRVPAILHSPLLPNPGNVTNQLHHVTDWFSTILAIAGGKASDVDGFNHWDTFAGLSDKPKKKQRRKLICNMQNVGQFKAAVRFDDHKLLVGRMAAVKWVPLSTSDDKPPEGQQGNNQSLEHTELPLVASVNFQFTHSQITSNDLMVTETNRRGNESLDNEGNNSSYQSAATLESNSTTDGMSILSLNILQERVTEKENFIRWGALKKHPKLKWKPKVVETMEKYVKDKTMFRLFNIKDDPEERNNLSRKKIHKLHLMVNFLSKQIEHMVPVPPKIRVRKGHPGMWNNVWSPGWCRARW